jgi:hypothetical protein
MVLNPPWTRPDTEACVRCDHAPKFHRPSCHHLLTWQQLWRRCSCEGYVPPGTSPETVDQDPSRGSTA